MAFIAKNIRVSNLTVGPLSGGVGGSGGGGGGSSEPSYLAVGAHRVGSDVGEVYVYDASNYSTTPTKIAPSGLGADDQFGIAVAATSNYIAVGAMGDDDLGSNAGAVYVYDATNLSATPTKLRMPDYSSNDYYFGSSLAFNSSQLIIGTYYETNPSALFAGAAYVYNISNLSATPTKLVPSGLDSNDNFGHSVAATTNQIVVGAPFDDGSVGNEGAVYVYDASNLSATPTKLAPTGLGSNDQFGYSIAASSNHIVVGAHYDDDQGDNAGAVYVYDANNLSATPTKLAPSGIGDGDYFGHSVAVQGNQIVVGAYGDDDQDYNSGAVYVFDANNLSNTPTKLAPTSLGNSYQFGKSVSIQGSQIVVGANQDSENSLYSGAVYVYDANNLSATPTKLAPSDLTNYDRFGYSLSLG